MSLCAYPQEQTNNIAALTLLFIRVFFFSNSSLARGDSRKIKKGGKPPPQADYQIKYCFIFCLISTRSSITPLIRHIILLQKVSLIYAESDLDILSSGYRDFIIPGVCLENLLSSRVQTKLMSSRMTWGINEVFAVSSAHAGSSKSFAGPYSSVFHCLSDSMYNDNKVADAFEIRHHWHSLSICWDIF